MDLTKEESKSALESLESLATNSCQESVNQESRKMAGSHIAKEAQKSECKKMYECEIRKKHKLKWDSMCKRHEHAAQQRAAAEAAESAEKQAFELKVNQEVDEKMLVMNETIQEKYLSPLNVPAATIPHVMEEEFPQE